MIVRDGQMASLRKAALGEFERTMVHRLDAAGFGTRLGRQGLVERVSEGTELALTFHVDDAVNMERFLRRFVMLPRGFEEQPELSWFLETLSDGRLEPGEKMNEVDRLWLSHFSGGL